MVASVIVGSGPGAWHLIDWLGMSCVDHSYLYSTLAACVVGTCCLMIILSWIQRNQHDRQKQIKIHG
jgi:fluoride ion exporter CrcB/FEX